MHLDGLNEKLLITAGGRIHCLRCQARSSRTKQQCRKPALKASRTQKCGHHGGAPKRITLKHGQATLAARAERSRDSARLSALEDSLRLLGLSDEPRTPGRKAKGYRPVRSFADLDELMRNDHAE